jgi:hypothetical protein
MESVSNLYCECEIRHHNGNSLNRNQKSGIELRRKLRHLDMQETLKPIEENGFLLMDFTPETITLRYFKWNQKSQSITDIDRLEPFHTTELKRA